MARLNYGKMQPPSQKPKTEVMPYKPSNREPKTEVMPYRPGNQGGPSAGAVPSEISRGQQQRTTGGVTPTSKTVNKIYRPSI